MKTKKWRRLIVATVLSTMLTMHGFSVLSYAQVNEQEAAEESATEGENNAETTVTQEVKKYAFPINWRQKILKMESRVATKKKTPIKELPPYRERPGQQLRKMLIMPIMPIRFIMGTKPKRMTNFLPMPDSLLALRRRAEKYFI